MHLFNFASLRQEIKVSVLRTIIRLRDEPEGAHPTAASRHPSALSVLHADVHAKQHGASPHRPGAQA